MAITDLLTFVRTGFDFSTPQLALMRRSIGRECTDAEFDEFIAVSRLSALDPLRRQIVPFIVNANNIQTRRMLPRTTIDGLRAIAARHGDYRPMETAPSITCDADRIDPHANPFGIVRAEVRAWKLRDGVWHPVCGEAWWDEYAPVRPHGDGEAAMLDPMWARMGRVMIAKCAEAQALRRGWPDVISGLYGEEELQSANLREVLASERVRARDIEIPSGGQSLWFCFDPTVALEAVSRYEIAGRLLEHYGQLRSSYEFFEFERRNRQSLQIFWEWQPCDAHILKELAEERAALLSQCAEASQNSELS